MSSPRPGIFQKRNKVPRMLEQPAAGQTELERTILEVLEGASSASQFVACLDETQSRLLELQRQFRESVEGESSQVRSFLAGEIAATEKSFQDYFALLASAEGYISDQDPARLEAVLSNLELVVARLNFDFVRYRETVSAERGPTTHPGLNLLHHLLVAGAPPEDVSSALEGEQLRIDSLLQGLSDSQDPLAELQRNFLALYQEQLDLGEHMTVEHCLELGRQYSRIDLDFLARRYGQGPTALACCNLVINVAWLFSQGLVEPETLQSALQSAEQILSETLINHAQFQRGLSEQDPSFMDGQEVSQAIESMLDTLEGYYQWISEPMTESLPPLVEQLELASQKSLKAFTSLSNPQAAGTDCPICGFRCAQGITRCTRCGAQVSSGGLSDIREEQSDQAGASRFNQVLALARQVLVSPKSLPHLEDEIQQLKIGLEQARKNFRPLDPKGQDSSTQIQLTRVGSVYQQGLESMQAAIDSLESFLEQPTEAGLSEIGQFLEVAGAKFTSVQNQASALK